MNICPTCQGFRGFVNDSEGRKPCLCDLPPTPSRPVSTPNAPDLPAGLREAVEKALPRDRSNKHIISWPADYAETVDQLIAAITPFLAAPIPVTAPLPASEGTARTDAALLVYGHIEVVPVFVARTLELENQSLQRRLGEAIALLEEAAEPDSNAMAAQWDRDAQALIRSATLARLTPSASQSVEMERMEAAVTKLRPYLALSQDATEVREILKSHFTTPTQ
jgi:hypothetical protein